MASTSVCLRPRRSWASWNEANTGSMVRQRAAEAGAASWDPCARPLRRSEGLQHTRALSAPARSISREQPRRCPEIGTPEESGSPRSLTTTVPEGSIENEAPQIEGLFFKASRDLSWRLSQHEKEPPGMIILTAAELPVVL